MASTSSTSCTSASSAPSSAPSSASASSSSSSSSSTSTTSVMLSRGYYVHSGVSKAAQLVIDNFRVKWDSTSLYYQYAFTITSQNPPKPSMEERKLLMEFRIDICSARSDGAYHAGCGVPNMQICFVRADDGGKERFKAPDITHQLSDEEVIAVCGDSDNLPESLEKKVLAAIAVLLTTTIYPKNKYELTSCHLEKGRFGGGADGKKK